ncbi:MAG: ROK family protein [Terriglobia bacterium]
MRKNGSRRWLAGIDLGVTHYRIGIVEAATGKIHQLTKLKTAGFTLQQFCDALAKVARPYRKDLVGIGVAIPGFPDRAQRRVLTTCGTVPFLESCDVAEAVEERLNVQTWVDNDARAHAVGEFQYGGWGKPRSLVVMTLGTGVGLAWHVEGRLYPPPDHGAQGGHMSAFPTTGNPCFCGVSGCLESLAGGTAIAAAANECLARFYPSKLCAPADAEQICRLGTSDALAQKCIARAIEALRGALHTIHHLYFPDVLVLGGSASFGLWPHLGPLRRWFARAERFDGGCNRLVLSRLGDKAGVLGAAALALSKLAPAE